MENHSAIANQLEQLDAVRTILQSQLGREVSKPRAEVDVKPLLQLLKEVAELDTGEQECIASDCAKALATFTAKHKHTL